MPNVQRLRAVARVAGARYSALYLGRGLAYRVLRVLLRITRRFPELPLVSKVRAIITAIEQGLVSSERRNGIAEPWSATSARFTIADNRTWWNRHDWSWCGEEWTSSAEWKASVVNRFLLPYIPCGGTVVEIGPGAGRWTEFLARRAAWLFLIDVSERALDLCRARFAEHRTVRFLLTDKPAVALPDGSVDAIWSYDVFVHVNPYDTRSYFREFRRVLRAGGAVVLHHPGAPPPGGEDRPGTRSDLTDRMVLEFGKENGLELVEQTRELVNEGDVLSIFRKPAS